MNAGLAAATDAIKLVTMSTPALDQVLEAITACEKTGVTLSSPFRRMQIKAEAQQHFMFGRYDDAFSMFVISPDNPTTHKFRERLSEDEVVDFACAVLQAATTSQLDSVKRSDIFANKNTPQKDALCSFMKSFAEYAKKPFLMREGGEVGHINSICAPHLFSPVAGLISNTNL